MVLSSLCHTAFCTIFAFDMELSLWCMQLCNWVMCIAFIRIKGDKIAKQIANKIAALKKAMIAPMGTIEQMSICMYNTFNKMNIGSVYSSSDTDSGTLAPISTIVSHFANDQKKTNEVLI